MLTTVGSSLHELEGIVCFAGPGSFTSLRIGITTANTLAYASGAPIIAETGEKWLENALERLKNGENEKIAKPLYGSEPHITPPKK
jgi:tRNA threonylcarbamoyladenosine biosynthesis protein TsaB